MGKLSEIKVTYERISFGKITRSDDIEKFLRTIWDEDTMSIHEEFKVIFLNHNLEIIGYKTIGRGGISSVNVDVRILFSYALASLATAIVIAHNHPSGKLISSTADNNLTNRVKEIGKILDIDLIDHIILTTDSYYSYADEGLL